MLITTTELFKLFSHYKYEIDNDVKGNWLSEFCNISNATADVCNKVLFENAELPNDEIANRRLLSYLSDYGFGSWVYDTPLTAVDYTRESLVDKINDVLTKMLVNKNSAVTHWITLASDEKNDYAIVIGWDSGFDKNEDETIYSDGKGYRICAKLAYCPHNSLMKDYDIDWLMPTFEDGEVYVTDLSFYEPCDLNDVDWWLNGLKKIALGEVACNG